MQGLLYGGCDFFNNPNMNVVELEFDFVKLVGLVQIDCDPKHQLILRLFGKWCVLIVMANV